MKIASYPYVYAIYIAILCGCFAMKEFLLSTLVLWKYALIPSKIQKFQIWRLITYHFFPANSVHFILNSAILLQTGSNLESLIGHFGFFMHSIIVALLVGIVYTFLALITTLFDVYKTYNSPIIGPFGFLIAFSCIDAYITEQKYRSVFGVFHVPTKFYPYIMIVCCHIALPNASYLSSISGLIVGTAYSMMQFKPPPKKMNRKKENASRYITSMSTERETSNEAHVHSPFALFTLSWLYKDIKHSMADKV